MNNLEKMARRTRRELRRPPRVRERPISKGAKAYARRILPRIQKISYGYQTLVAAAEERCVALRQLLEEIAFRKLLGDEVPAGAQAHVHEEIVAAQRRRHDLVVAMHGVDDLYVRRANAMRRA